MKFILTTPIQPYTRMTRRGKFVNPRALAYLASQEALAYQFKEQCQAMLPAKTPLSVSIILETPTVHKGDASNILKAIEDSAQGIVFGNDCWIDEIYIKRVKATDHRATVTIEPMEGRAL